MRKVIPVLSIMAGLYWLIQGYFYGVWVRNGPGGGFFPIVAGLTVVVFSLIVLWKDMGKHSPSQFSWLAFLPAAALLTMVIFSYLVGMIISMMLYIFSWLKFAEKHTVSRSLLISLGTTAVVYGIFVVWLNVPMPKGLLGLF